MILMTLIMVTATILSTSCEIESADGTVRTVGVDVSGVYRGTADTLLVKRNSGNPISQLDLRQNGDQLQAIDNNGIVFKGTIGNVSTTTSSGGTGTTVNVEYGDSTFTLSGKTSSGNNGTITGIITPEKIMRGTWIEDGLTSTVYGTAVGGGVNAPLTITADDTTLRTNTSTRLTASGGSGYEWRVSNSELGSLSPTTGDEVRYNTTDRTGPNTITLNAGGESTTIVIITEE